MTEASEISFLLIIKKSSELEFTVLVFAFEHEDVVDPDGKPVEAEHSLHFAGVFPAQSLLSMIKNEGRISEEHDRGVVLEKLFHFDDRIYYEWSINTKELLNKFLSVQGIINFLVSLMLVLDLFKNLSILH